MWAIFAKLPDGSWHLHTMTLHEEIASEIEEHLNQMDDIAKVKVIDLED